MSGVEVLGGLAAGLQLVQQVWALGSRILEKPKDTKALAAIRTEAQTYSTQLQEWEKIMKDEALTACQRLRTALDDIIGQIDSLKTRGKRTKTLTALKLYKPEFHEKFADALDEFKVRMCFESQRSAGEMNEKLTDITTMMNGLRLNAETLVNKPGMEPAISAIHEKMTRLADDIRAMKAAVQEIEHAMRELSKTVPTIVPQVEKGIRIDGEITREKIQDSTAMVIDRFDNLDRRLDTNDSLTRIKGEILPNATSIKWYDDAEPAFRLWSLDGGSDIGGSQRSRPTAQYEGMEVSSVRLERVEQVYEKRHIADDVDEHIRERKRRRVNVVSAYLGLAKRGEYFEELQEYMPPELHERFKDLPPEIQRGALQLARRIGQESRYAVLDRVIRQKVHALPTLHVIEDMERAMLALQTEKLEVTLGFYLKHTIDNRNYMYNLCVSISR
jgi:uncharacterized protein YoxC